MATVVISDVEHSDNSVSVGSAVRVVSDLNIYNIPFENGVLRRVFGPKRVAKIRG
jgi:hypothetical protein